MQNTCTVHSPAVGAPGRAQIKLPTFDCPFCGAKRILFAGDKESKNGTVLLSFERSHGADYVILCPKCRRYIAVLRKGEKYDPS